MDAQEMMGMALLVASYQLCTEKGWITDWERRHDGSWTVSVPGQSPYEFQNDREAAAFSSGMLVAG